MLQKRIRTMVICFNLKTTSQKYGCHVCTTWRMAIIYFSYVDLPRLRPLNAWLVKAKGQPSCASTTPIPVPEASDSTTKVLLKSGDAGIGVVHMAHFNYVIAWSTTCFQ